MVNEQVELYYQWEQRSAAFNLDAHQFNGGKVSVSPKMLSCKYFWSVSQFVAAYAAPLYLMFH